MFASLFASKSPDSTRDISASQAMAALMVRIAKSDDDYSTTEIARIDAVLGLLYSLTADQAADLRQTAEALEAEAPDTVRFTRAIKEEVPYEERFNVVRALWQVVLADGARDAEEDALMRLLASLLGVNDRDSALARQQA
ncbi:MAG: TerB family tellurite resistance protein [Planktomarina sp.]|uniref:tellurite resistance TerB family protein n=1 Tax=Planktomarina sp. TaxID=2024851 RepID=UPI003260DAE1|nr:TerB family tellurite resistance protein [Planktomarina sp.]